MSRYKNLAQEMRESGILAHLMFWLVPITLASIWLVARDFRTNLLGFDDAMNFINNADGMSQTVTKWALAVTIQGLATIATYTFFLIAPDSPTKRNVRFLVGLIALGALSFDIWFGYLHYIHPNAAKASLFDSANWENPAIRLYFIHALLHSVVVDTLLSEVLSSWSLGLIYNLRADYKQHGGDLTKAVQALSKKVNEMQRGRKAPAQRGTERR